MKENKRIKLMLEFFLRGKRRKIPSVNFIGKPFVPLTQSGAKAEAAFEAFNKAAHEFAKQMKKLGEFE